MEGMDARSDEATENEMSFTQLFGPSKQEAIPVPLPTEIPPPPNFSQLPPAILHSGTVETLIGLNEDLMARLKVNIRRNSILEQQIMDNEKRHGDLARVNSSLTAQLQVMQEKDRFLREKNSRVELLDNRLRSLEAQNGKLTTELRKESAFRRRIEKWVRPFITRLKTELGAEQMRAQILDERLAARDAQLSDVRARLTEAVTHIQNQDKLFSKDQAKLVEQYESKRSQLEKEIERLRAEMKPLKDKAQRMDEAVSLHAEAQNRIIYLERRTRELESGLQNEVADFQAQAVKYRQEAKMLAVETLELDRKLREATEKLQAKSDSFNRLQDQFESLQTLWADAQKKLEATRLQTESLNMLNQELSRQLKEQRKAKEGLRTAGEAAPLTNVDKAAQSRIHDLEILEDDSADKRPEA